MKKYVQVVVGLVISVAFIYIALRGIEPAQIVTAFKKANLLFVIPALGLSMLCFYWRCPRWKILLSKEKDIPAHRLFPSVMIGFGLNNIFPLRAGEFARPYALLKQEGIPYPVGLSTLVLERILDSISLLVLLILIQFFAPLGDLKIREVPIADIARGISVVAAILIVGVLSLVVPAAKRFYLWILEKLPLIPTGLKGKLAGLIEMFARGFESIKDPKLLLPLVVHTAIIWVLLAASFWVMSIGFPGVTMTFGQSMGFLVITCMAVALPSSPGFWGVYEAAGQLALVAMGVVPGTAEGKAAAFAYTVLVHLIQWAPLAALGLYYSAKLSISTTDAQKAAENSGTGSAT